MRGGPHGSESRDEGADLALGKSCFCGARDRESAKPQCTRTGAKRKTLARIFRADATSSRQKLPLRGLALGVGARCTVKALKGFYSSCPAYF